MAEVLLFVADGTEEIEALTVVDLLRRVGVEVDIVSIEDSIEVEGSHAIIIKADKMLCEAKWEEAKMLVLPGGMPGTNRLMACETLVEKLKEFNEQGKFLAAICAAPMVLGVNGILEGRNATSYPGFEDKLIGANCVTDAVAADGNVITSRGLGTAIEFSSAIITALRDDAVAKDVLKKIIYGGNNA